MKYLSWESNVTNINNVTRINQLLVTISKLKLSPHVISIGSRRTGRTVCPEPIQFSHFLLKSGLNKWQNISLFKKRTCLHFKIINKFKNRLSQRECCLKASILLPDISSSPYSMKLKNKRKDMSKAGTWQTLVGKEQERPKKP